MAKQILILRGPEDRLPSRLEEGELAFCLDSKKLFIGGSAENVLLADGNGGGDSSAAYVYKCTGTDDNVVICQIVESFLGTNDGVQNLKLYIEGVAGVNQTAFGVGSSSNPYKVFYENGDNPYGKKVVLDGSNCTFPKIAIFDTDNNSVYMHYFNMKNVGIENMNIEAEVTCWSGSCGVYGFYKCNNLRNCKSIARGEKKQSEYASGYGFYECSNLSDCVGVGTAVIPTNGICDGGGFYKCTNLINCKGIGQSVSNCYGFYSCENMNNCQGEGVSDFGRAYGFYCCSKLSNCNGSGSTSSTDTSDSSKEGYGFFDCTDMSNCIGKGTGIGHVAGIGYGFSKCTRLSNCIGDGMGKCTNSGYGNVYGRGFSECADIANCIGTGVCEGLQSRNGCGFHECKRLNNCVGLGYRVTGASGSGYGFYWGSSTTNVAQMVNCTAPTKAKSGYTQDYGMLLDGTTNGAKYSLIGNAIAPDSGGFVGIKKHTQTGSEYTETGTIRANVE